MEAPRLERKLVAILAADIEGYSRHMERDEHATLTVLSSHRLIIDGLIAGHGGRVTGTAGDSVVAEFGSVVEAVVCAVEVQRELATANAALPVEERLQLRIGINVGDVMVKDGDIFGDGVNIAARLESLAEPGGVCVSRGVRDHVRKHKLVAFEDLGEQKVKNISHPVRAFRVRPLGNGADLDVGANEATEDEAPALSSVTAGDEAGIEIAFWDSIKDSQDRAEFDFYLDRYPDSSFAVLAKARRDALAAAQDAPAVVAEEDEAVAVELAFWDAVKDSTEPTEFEAYLQRYPAGSFVALAESRLAALREAAKPGAAPEHDTIEVELAFWSSIKDSGNADMFRAYLDRYPHGPFAALAEINIAQLGASN